MSRTTQLCHAKGAWPGRAHRRLLGGGGLGLWGSGLGRRFALAGGHGTPVYFMRSAFYTHWAPRNPRPPPGFLLQNHYDYNSISLVLFAIWTNMKAFSFFMFSCNLLLSIEKLCSQLTEVGM